MLKSLVTLAAASVAFAPIAAAGPTEVPVELEYDGALLATEEGAEYVIASLKDQARVACTYRSSLTFVNKLDRACAEDVLVEAATGIIAEREAEGLETASNFTMLATVEMASLD